MLLPLIRYLIFEKPDVIFSAEDHLNSIVIIASILSFSKAKISVSSRVTQLILIEIQILFFQKAGF